MKKLMSILAVALFAFGAMASNLDNGADQPLGTDGGVNKTSGRP